MRRCDPLLHMSHRALYKYVYYYVVVVVVVVVVDVIVVVVDVDVVVVVIIAWSVCLLERVLSLLGTR